MNFAVEKHPTPTAPFTNAMKDPYGTIANTTFEQIADSSYFLISFGSCEIKQYRSL
jgi:hypothetical protein